MAKFMTMTTEQEKHWSDWLSERPDCVQTLAKQFPPDRLYRMKSTNHRVYVYSYSEENTLGVIVSGQFNKVMFDRKVFGVAADDLEECDLPLPGEPLGAELTENSDIEEVIQMMGQAMREEGLDG